MKKTPPSSALNKAAGTSKAVVAGKAAGGTKARPVAAKTQGRAERSERAERAFAANPNAPEDIRDAVSRLKRERIIATAVELFYNHGLSNTTLEAVADRMNVTKPFIYSHFKSKNELLAEICSRGIRASLDALNRALALGGSATDKLQTLARDFMLAVLSNQAHIAIYNREEKHLSAKDSEAINHMRREFDRKFCALLNEGVASGEFTVDDVQLTSLAIGGIVSWSYVWFRPNGRLSPTETADHVADLVLAMVQAKAKRKRVRAA
jgi:TetR/AcrR family transcriptional regulator, cholesterol catabolism regulator